MSYKIVGKRYKIRVETNHPQPKLKITLSGTGVEGVLADEEGEIAVVFRQDGALLGILDRDHALGVIVAAHEVFRGNGETFDNTGAEHGDK